MIINAPQVEKYEPMKKAEVDAMIQQVNSAFAQGVPEHETVAFPTIILARLLKTILHLGETNKVEPMDLSNLFGDEEKTETLTQEEVTSTPKE